MDYREVTGAGPRETVGPSESGPAVVLVASAVVLVAARSVFLDVPAVALLDPTSVSVSPVASLHDAAVGPSRQRDNPNGWNACVLASTLLGSVEITTNAKKSVYTLDNWRCRKMNGR
ncbi:hypothetical protein K505DRAFT_332452 [Melanomma pulvis-pyrius CBS 109.77]|uniref:Uncharacterized protein n=1 Tax=Melanomma pulvis-pyrius CBS 109.77 TaxID=1314802 RepID=A0A6A6XSH1_9PLEO|nr:hypothetical protein K505DRAFT_332452 [Melanomma pulvis-pyrius CBS 109.77]